MRKNRINLFALPSQTTILFWLITSTLLGAMLIGLTGAHIIPMWPLAFVLLLLPLREFIMRPERVIRQYGLTSASVDEFPALLLLIDTLAKQMRLNQVPQLLIDQNRDEIYEMGSFRRLYIVLGVDKARKQEGLLANPRKEKLVEVLFLHELCHLKNGDYWQLGYLTELFKVSFNLMIWVLLFLGGWGILLILVKDAFFKFSTADLLQNMPADVRPMMEQILPSLFPSAAEIEILRVKAEGINLAWVLTFIANISVPYIFLTGILWRFYRPLLWRIREFYADAGVFIFQKSIKPFAEFIRRTGQIRFQSNPVTTTPSYSDWIQKVIGKAQTFLSINFWPDFSKRLLALKNPESVFYTWKQIAWLLGSLVLLLEMFLATPIALPLSGKNPMSFTTLVVIEALIYFLLPQIVIGKSAWKDGLRVLFVVFLIRTAWLLFTLALMWGLFFVQPEFLSSVLQSAISSIARYAGNDPIGIDLFDFLVEASVINLLQIPIIFIIQIVSVTGLLFLVKRALQWYSFIRDSQRFKWIVFSLTFGVLFVLLTLAMPISMAMLKGDFSAFMGASGVFAILGLLMLVVGGVWLYFQDRKYYQKCPVCKSESEFDKKCTSCGSILHNWLWVEYDDE